MSKPTNRHEGKPLLRLLECYVLKSIGELSADDETHLRTLAPALARSLGHQGTWDQIIAGTMDLPPNMPQLILETWHDNQQIAQEQNVTLEPQEFAEMFVDANLT